MVNAYGEEIIQEGQDDNMYGDEEMLLNDDGTHMHDLAAVEGEDQYFYNQ